MRFDSRCGDIGVKIPRAAAYLKLIKASRSKRSNQLRFDGVASAILGVIVNM